MKGPCLATHKGDNHSAIDCEEVYLKLESASRSKILIIQPCVELNDVRMMDAYTLYAITGSLFAISLPIFWYLKG